MHLILQLINRLKSKNESYHFKENTMLKIHLLFLNAHQKIIRIYIMQ